MPLYTFRCNKCDVVEEAILPIANRNDVILHHCGSELVRVMSLPQTAIIVPTARDWAIDSLNGDGKGNNGLSPNERGKGLEKHIMKGLDRNRPMQYTGF